MGDHDEVLDNARALIRDADADGWVLDDGSSDFVLDRYGNVVCSTDNPSQALFIAAAPSLVADLVAALSGAGGAPVPADEPPTWEELGGMWAKKHDYVFWTGTATSAYPLHRGWEVSLESWLHKFGSESDARRFVADLQALGTVSGSPTSSEAE